MEVVIYRSATGFDCVTLILFPTRATPDHTPAYQRTHAFAITTTVSPVTTTTQLPVIAYTWPNLFLGSYHEELKSWGIVIISCCIRGFLSR